MDWRETVSLASSDWLSPSRPQLFQIDFFKNHGISPLIVEYLGISSIRTNLVSPVVFMNHTGSCWPNLHRYLISYSNPTPIYCTVAVWVFHPSKSLDMSWFPLTCFSNRLMRLFNLFISFRACMWPTCLRKIGIHMVPIKTSPSSTKKHLMTFSFDMHICQKIKILSIIVGWLTWIFWEYSKEFLYFIGF